MPKVSVCIPIYNVEKYIGRCIESIQNQTLTDVEIILVNDKSPDKSKYIARQYAAEDARIKIIEHDKNRGLMTARHSAYVVAQGDYITFCDSDDSLPADALELLYSKALETSADIVAGPFEIICDNGTSYVKPIQLRYGTDAHGLAKSLLNREIGHQLCGKLFVRSLLQNYEYDSFDNFTNGEDGCLFYQLLCNLHKIVTVEEPVYNYYQNNGSSTHVRLSNNALDNILHANTYRIQSCSRFPDLKPELFRMVSSIMIALYASGYDKNGCLTELLKNYGLKKYTHFNHIAKYFDKKMFFRLLLQRYITANINRYKNESYNLRRRFSSEADGTRIDYS